MIKDCVEKMREHTDQLNSYKRCELMHTYRHLKYDGQSILMLMDTAEKLIHDGK